VCAGEHQHRRLDHRQRPGPLRVFWITVLAGEHAELVLVGAIGRAATPGGGLDVHVPPDVDIGDLVSTPDDPFAIRVRVVGHFRDAASAHCDRTPEVPGYPELDEVLDELWCSQHFVVETIRAAP
jgi:hypothetical protein